jgi:SAM-dependent methyltransferase
MTTFDPVRYKQTTLEQWQTAARAWSDWSPLLRRWLGPATELMLDMCHVHAGSRVLDVAAGAGDQSLQAAERVGVSGRVLATDISPNLVELAASNARAASLRVETRVLDGEALDVPPASFDAVISRGGLTYFLDPQRALAGMTAALVRGGRIGAIVCSTADRNPFLSTPASIIRRRAGLPPPAPRQPGPFALGAPGVLERVLADAGFRSIEVRAVAAPLRTTSASECVRFERESFGALHHMLAGLDPAEREEAWREIEDALGAYEADGAFAAPCELLVAAGVK